MPDPYQHFFDSFITQIKASTIWEWLAVISGIASVWFSRRASVWTYPVGLVSTVIYTWLSFERHLIGESAVNFYYTIMSIYGWYLWLLRNDRQETVVRVEFSDAKMIRYQWMFFIVCYIAIFCALTFLKHIFYEGVIPWADALASATAFTGMWLMARKKVESWHWWIATNIASIPLYYVKELALTSVYYFILLIFAFWGLAAWKKKARERNT